MAIKIDKPIADYEVVKPDDNPEQPAQVAEPAEPDVQHMHEYIERPERLEGSTYKIKTPLDEHALYVTINDVVLNPDTEHETRRPFEVFINSKNMDHFQWIVALTRIISAVFRKGGDCTFLVEELRSVFDPRGGYFKKGGKFMPSIVAEIGETIEHHLRLIGMLPQEQLDDHMKAYLEAKKQEYKANNEPGGPEPQAQTQEDCDDSSDFPEGSVLCSKCHTKAMIVMDGCLTCLNCGESKCG
jgi:hypothetical protein